MCPRPRLDYIATIHQTTYAQGGIVKSIANPHDQTKAGRCILIVSPYQRRPEGEGAAVKAHCSSHLSAILSIGRAGAAPPIYPALMIQIQMHASCPPLTAGSSQLSAMLSIGRRSSSSGDSSGLRGFMQMKEEGKPVCRGVMHEIKTCVIVWKCEMHQWRVGMRGCRLMPMTHTPVCRWPTRMERVAERKGWVQRQQVVQVSGSGTGVAEDEDRLGVQRLPRDAAAKQQPEWM